MFLEHSPEMRSDMLEMGEMEFIPALKVRGPKIVSYMKHTAVFSYNKGGGDEVAEFYLTMQGDRYEITRLSLVTNIGSALKLFMMELILKNAIKEASYSKMAELTVDCKDPLIVDAFLACHFRVRSFDSAITGHGKIYHGAKTVDV